MEIPIEAGKGIYLIGEAANAYVRYKYFDTIIHFLGLVVISIFFAWALTAVFKKMWGPND
jgi:hypothetical protein